MATSKPAMISENMLLYLHQLSKQVGRCEEYKELEQLTSAEATKKSWHYQKVLEERKAKYAKKHI